VTVAGLPAGYLVRPIELAEVDGYLDGPDVDLAFEVMCQVELSLLPEPDITRESVRHQLTSAEAAVDEHRLVLDAVGQPVGVFIVEVDRVGRRIFIEPSAVPGQHLLPALIDLGLATAHRLVEGASGWHVETGAYEGDEGFRAALEAAGFEVIRRFWRMQIDFTGPVPEPSPPAGVTATVAASQADRRILHSVTESAFAEHFGSVPSRYEEWLGWFLARRDAMPQTWRLAWLDGEPVAAITCDASRADRGLGYIRTLGVLPAARRRGIAGWLLQCAFADAARQGFRGVCLGVDSENEAGAVDLYLRHGMQAQQVVDLFRRSIDQPSN